MAGRSGEARVFLSHASQDIAPVRALCAGLEDRGFRCWMAPRDVPAGADYVESIVQAITACSVFVIFVSASAADSPHVRRELDLAVGAHLPIVPVRLEDLEPDGWMGYFLKNVQWVDAWDGTSADHVDLIAVAVATVVEHGPEASPAPEEGRAPVRGRRRVVPVVAVGVVLLAVVGWLVVDGAFGDRTQPLTRVEVNEDPIAVTAAFGSLWVASAESTLEQVDPTAARVVHESRLAGLPVAVAAQSGSVWVASSGRLEPVDSSTGAPLDPVALPFEPSAIAAGDGALIVGSVDGRLASVDTRSGAAAAPARVGDRLSGVAWGDEGLWVSDYAAGTVSEIDPGDLSVRTTFPVGRQPSDIEVGGGSVWVASEQSERVVRVDPRRGRPRDIAVGHAPAAIAVGGGSLWVGDRREGSVLRIDLRSGEVLGREDVAPGITALTVGDGVVWVAGEESDEVVGLDIETFGS